MTFSYGHSHLVPYKTFDFKLYGQKFDVPTFDDLKASSLIQLSGGIDSTYVLWKWLQENPNEFCVAHHIKLNGVDENRVQEESEAVDKILKWFDSKGLNNYFYLENTFDYGNFTSCIYDVELCGFLAGVILYSPRWGSVTKMIHSIYESESERETKRKRLMQITCERTIESFYPLKNKEKWQVINEMPQELLELCWFCRTPNSGKPCGECHTCKEVEESKEIIYQENLKGYLRNL
jgi:hypothetical protein